MDPLTEAILNGAAPDELIRAPVPSDYVAARLRAEDVGIFAEVADKDVRRSRQVVRVPTPELGGGYSARHDQHFQVVGSDMAGTRP
jgi:crotonyl-CoA reductase